MIEQYGLGIFTVLVFLALPFLIAVFLAIKIFLLILKGRKKFNKR